MFIRIIFIFFVKFSFYFSRNFRVIFREIFALFFREICALFFSRNFRIIFFGIFWQNFRIFYFVKISHFFAKQIEAKFREKSENFRIFRERTKCENAAKWSQKKQIS